MVTLNLEDGSLQSSRYRGINIKMDVSGTEFSIQFVLRRRELPSWPRDAPLTSPRQRSVPRPSAQ